LSSPVAKPVDQQMLRSTAESGLLVREQPSVSPSRSDVQMQQFVSVMEAQVNAQKEALVEQQQLMLRQQHLALTTGSFEKFDGSDLDYFPVWLSAVRDRVTQNGLDEEDGFRHVMRCLGGSARALVIKSDLPKKFSDVIQYLERRFTDQYRSRVKAVEFATRSQLVCESVREFVNALDALCPVVEGDPTYDLMMLMQLIQGLRLEEHRKVASEGLVSGKSVREIEGRLLMKEAALKMRQELMSDELKDVSKSDSKESENESSGAETVNALFVERRRCYVCGFVGHIASVCTRRRSSYVRKCWSCGSTGHLVSQCEKKSNIRRVCTIGGQVQPSSTVGGSNLSISIGNVLLDVNDEQLLMDTGAKVDCVSSSFVQRLGVPVGPTDVQLVAVNKSIVKCLGVCRLPVIFDGVRVNWLFRVAEIGDSSVIVGRRLLRALGVSMVTRSGTKIPLKCGRGGSVAVVGGVSSVFRKGEETCGQQSVVCDAVASASGVTGVGHVVMRSREHVVFRPPSRPTATTVSGSKPTRAPTSPAIVRRPVSRPLNVPSRSRMCSTVYVNDARHVNWRRRPPNKI
jgi:hypothetical protein